MAHGDAREGKWRGNWRMEWVSSTLHTTSEHGVSNITTADAHNSAASRRLNWRPCLFKWTRPFRRKSKSVFCSCAITFQTQSTYGCIGPVSSVVTPTDYGLDDPVSNTSGDENFRLSRPALGPNPASCKMGTGSTPEVKCSRGVLLTTHPLLVPWSWKSRAIPLPTLWATPGL